MQREYFKRKMGYYNQTQIIKGVVFMNNEKKWNIGEGGDMPIGFGLSLAANAKSMEAFAKMSDAEKEAVVEESRQMHTRNDMENYVNRLGERYL